MDNPCAQDLASLFDKTHQVLRFYHNKNQWPKIYPLLCQLAEQYYTLYQTHPNAMQAQLCLYVDSHGYTTNLVVNQCVIICALCHSLSYDSKITQLLICVCLTNYLCVQTQTNKLALRQPLNLQEKKQWQSRHQLAVKLLQAANIPTAHIAGILSRLNKYKQALLSTPKIMLYDGPTTLVALANVIAMNITYRTQNDHVDIYKAIADIYIRTPNLFAQHALKALIAHIGPYLPGALIQYHDQQLTYVGKDSRQRHVLIALSEQQKAKWYSVKARLESNSKQRPSIDKRLLFSVWFTDHIASPVKVIDAEKQQLLLLISQVKIQKEYSYSALAKLLSHRHTTIELLREAVRPYNKEHLAGKDLRHCLSMVGLYNAPAIIQQVLFEQLVNHQAHPLMQHVQLRLQAIIRLLDLLVSHDKHSQFELLALPIYGYVSYLIEHCSTTLSRKVLYEKQLKSDVSMPFSWLFGVTIDDSEHLTAYLLELLGDNPWTQALLDAEQQQKQLLSTQAQLWVAIKLVVIKVFQPNAQQSRWQTDTFEQVLKRLEWQSSKQFYSQLPSLGLCSSV
ncbi:hypothetical protein RC083_00160 [Pseudoalteromonas haloplanktis]|uniref:Orphan protein n=1 Tax=Pseudoalteromonas haloplanktis TaxID=228 RepID=A0ABU1B5Z1_PSEHA|nr:hypothetical protein [Pseudoalteromonas haloplanktis]MDQ9089993.1 hypothetical protein [Pseudoalteromonas haloplanktis]